MARHASFAGVVHFFAQISADPAWVEGGRLRKGWRQE
jgi:hypothetical protein